MVASTTNPFAYFDSTDSNHFTHTFYRPASYTVVYTVETNSKKARDLKSLNKLRESIPTKKVDNFKLKPTTATKSFECLKRFYISHFH